MNPILAKVEQPYLRAEPLADFRVGDTVNVHSRIREGDKERVQMYSGTVIAIKHGHGSINDAFTVRRLVEGVGVERVFPSHNPSLVRVEVVRRGRVRRAKLYYLRDRVGKATKVREKVISRAVRADAATAASMPQVEPVAATVVESATPTV